MTLIEISQLIVVPGEAKTTFFGGKPPDVHLAHARAAWKGKAHVQWVHFPSHVYGSYRIAGNGCSASYSPSFDDLMADDWELVAGEAA